MDYARTQRDPKRHLFGLGFVVVLHAFIVYAMVTGLARQAVEVIKKPIDVAIIEEIKPPPPPPPPPPPKKIVEPKPQTPPPQPFVPPPEIPPPQVLQAPTITAVTPTPPEQPYIIAPPAPPPPVVEAPPAPPAPKPAVRQGVSCQQLAKPEFPRQAIRAGVERGRVLARVTVDERGNVLDVAIVSADPPRHFDRTVLEALSQWKCAADGTRYVGTVEVTFSLKD